MRFRRIAAMATKTAGFGLVAAVGVATILGCGLVRDAKNVADTASVLGEFADRLNRSKELTYTAEYDVTGGGKVTLVQQPPRAAFLSDKGRFILTPEHMILCEAGTCHRAPNQNPEMIDAVTAGFVTNVAGPGFVTPEFALGLLAAAAFVPGAKVDSSEKTIAGRQSLCADVKNLEAATTPGQEALQDFSVCVADDGVLASFTGTGTAGGRASIQLSTFTENADAKAFTPPAGAKLVDVTRLPS